MKTLFSLIIFSALTFVNLVQAQLAGHYQIGPGGDFLTFTAAIDSLISQGVSDSVIFDIKTYYYRKQLTIPEIIGSDFIKTIAIQSEAGVAAGCLEISKEFILKLNYSYPFYPFATIYYELPSTAQVKIEVFNVLGQQVKRLIDKQQLVGYHSVRLEAGSLGSGVYFYRMTAKNVNNSTHSLTQIKKLIVLK
jgi:hypothetical protein